MFIILGTMKHAENGGSNMKLPIIHFLNSILKSPSTLYPTISKTMNVLIPKSEVERIDSQNIGQLNKRRVLKSS